MKCDVVIVRAGHNGLVCAAYLARAGLSVKVVNPVEIVPAPPLIDGSGQKTD